MMLRWYLSIDAGTLKQSSNIFKCPSEIELMDYFAKIGGINE